MIALLPIFCITTAVLALPSPKEIVLPEINVSSPDEINGLSEGKESRSIDGAAVENSFDETIKEVEAILKTNPNLPRLTRGEILDLLDNITQSDIEKASSSENNRDQKAIMVVMPYTPDSENNLQDFYTKPPITRMVGNENDNNRSVRKKPTSTSTTTTEAPVTYRRIPPKKQYTTKKRTKIEPNYATSTEYRTKGTKVPPTHSTSTPRHKDFNSKGTKVEPTRSRTTPRYTEFYSKSTTIEPTYSKTTPRYTEFYSTKVEPTTYSGTRKFTEYYSRYSTRPKPTTTTTEFYTEPTTPSTHRPRTRGTPMRRRRPTTKYPNHNYEQDLMVQENVQEEVYQPPSEQVFFNTKSQQFVPEEAVTKATTSSPTLVELNIPPHLTDVVRDMHLADAMDGTIALPTIKPIPEFKVKEEKDKIKDIMESLGIKTPPTTTESPNLENVASNLSPDMKDLLMSFGLIPNPNQPKDVKVEDPPPDKVEITPDSFVGFKPLPEDSSSRSEMDELLASFGLGRSSRKQKSLPKTPDTEHISLEAVPDEYKPLLAELGLRQGRKIDGNPVKKQHVFAPSDSQYATDAELDKLGRLINMVKELERLNRTITDEDLKKIDLETLKELAGSTKHDVTPLNEQTLAPNPINYDYGLSKNEVKRQEASTTTENPSIKDLEDSFGGRTSTSTTEAAVEETPAPKRTGAYFLLDWNSFLDIDDQKGKRVNLRFQPTVGDPKRFYSVSVP